MHKWVKSDKYILVNLREGIMKGDHSLWIFQLVFTTLLGHEIELVSFVYPESSLFLHKDQLVLSCNHHMATLLVPTFHTCSWICAISWKPVLEAIFFIHFSFFFSLFAPTPGLEKAAEPRIWYRSRYLWVLVWSSVSIWISCYSGSNALDSISET